MKYGFSYWLGVMAKEEYFHILFRLIMFSHEYYYTLTLSLCPIATIHVYCIAEVGMEEGL